MAGEISSCLQRLLQCLKAAPDPQEPANLVADIASLALHVESAASEALVISTLFDRECGVLMFLRQAATVDQLTSAKHDLLGFLEKFLSRIGKKVLPYAVDIKDMCMSLFVRDRMAKIKLSTFPVLSLVLEACANTSTADELNIAKVIDKLFMSCSNTKLSASVQGGLYHILGCIAETFPVQMLPYSERLISIYVKVLQKEMLGSKASAGGGGGGASSAAGAGGFTNKKPDMPVIAGCLRGLSSYLTNFTQSMEDNSPHAAHIFKFATISIDPKSLATMSRFDVPRAGLMLLSKHCIQFKELVKSRYKILYTWLRNACRHHNREMKSAAFLATESFLQTVAQNLDPGSSADIELFKVFIDSFRSIINSQESDTKEISIAIRGYGYFAEPCRRFMTSKDLQFMFNDMIQRSEHLFVTEEDLFEDKLSHLPSFLDALANILREMNDVSETSVVSLEKLVVLLMDQYPRFAVGYHTQCYRALSKVMLALAPHTSVLSSFLSHITYQGLIRSCSHPVLLDEVTISADGSVVGVGDSSSRPRSYLDYTQLWYHMIEAPHSKGLQLLWAAREQQKLVERTLYDELIASILKLLDKLDLSSTRMVGLDGELEVTDESTDEGQNKGQSGADTATAAAAVTEDEAVAASSDPTAGRQARMPKDFQIFLNLVELCRWLLPRVRTPFFSDWVLPFCRQLIVHSSKYPLVSGFYKLLLVAMKICSRISYFKECQAQEVGDDAMDTASSSSAVHQCFALLQKFTAEVLIRCRQYKDDLLASCLQFVLALPVELVAMDTERLVPSLQLALQLGLSYLPLAEAALDAMETWSNRLTKQMQPLFGSILPCLDDYLRTTPQTVTEGADAAEKRKLTVMVLKSKRQTTAHGRKLPLRVLRALSKNNKGDEPALTRVRHRIVHLLGSLGGHTSLQLVRGRADDTSSSASSSSLSNSGPAAGGAGTLSPAATSAVAWDSKRRLEFAVPFIDIKPNIHLDPFLPRIVELATSSSDRQTKVVACECLHSLAVYMIGKGSRQPDGAEKSPMGKLYKRVFPVFMQLACDVELVAVQLFRPLVFQLIHWLTSNRTFESTETMVLLDVILDGLVQAENTQLRDFSASCVCEFLTWSIKQSSAQQLEKSPINTKSLLKRLFSLALHPSAFKRLGAALAFNHIYTVLREEESLVDMFAIEILVNFLLSLRMAHQDASALGTQEHCCTAIRHLQRILKVKAKLFIKTSRNRRLPRGWREADLKHVVGWLMPQCGRPETEYRHQCMQLFCALAPLQPNVPNAANWVSRTCKTESGLRFVSWFESGGGRGGIGKYTTLPSFCRPFSLDRALVWLDLVLAALDCYSWAFGQNLLTPDMVFAATLQHEKYKASAVFSSLTFFLQKLAMKDIETAVSVCEVDALSGQTESRVFTPSEASKYNRSKCTVIVRMFNFLTVLLSSHTDATFKTLPSSVWCTELFELTARCVLQPNSVGFDMSDIEIVNQLPEETTQLCTLMARHLPREKRTLMTRTMGKLLATRRLDISSQVLTADLNSDHSLDHSHLNCLITGYRQLFEAGLLEDALLSGKGVTSDVSQLALDLLLLVMKTVTPVGIDIGGMDDSASTSGGHHLSPLSKSLCNNILHLVFVLGLDTGDLLATLTTGPAESVTRKSMVFLQTFSTTLCTHFTEQAKTLIPLLMTKAADYPILIGSILLAVLDHVSLNRALRKKHSSNLCGWLLRDWSKLEQWWNAENGAADTRQMAVVLLGRMLSLDAAAVLSPTKAGFKDMYSMYTSLLTEKSLTLTFKTSLLELLSHFATLQQSGCVSQLKTCLNRLVTECFPLSSSEYLKGSPKHNEYIAAIDKILSALVKSGSVMLLELLVTIIGREEEHAHEEAVQQALAAFAQRTSASKACDAITVLFNIFLSEDDYRSDVRQSVGLRMCLPLLKASSKEVVKDFFIKHIAAIMRVLEAKISKTTESVFRSHLVSKIVSYYLLELLYSRLTVDELNTTKSEVVKAFLNGDAVSKGNELTVKITKTANAARSEDMRGETVLLELRRQYHCAAHRCLVAIIMCTQTKQQFYHVFLFKEDRAKNQLVWDNIIDVGRQYDFSLEMEAPVAKKATSRLTVIRQKRVEQSSGLGQAFLPRYIASQYLADSSLGDEVSQYDFTKTSQSWARAAAASSASSSPQSLSDGTSPPGAAGSTAIAGDASSGGEDSALELELLEMDELNRHECMNSLLSLLDHMHVKKINPELPEDKIALEMPSWMSAIHQRLSDTSSKTNVLLFVAKLIVNRPQLFEPYARFWLCPLMELILSNRIASGIASAGASGAGSGGINNMVVDIIVTLLSWSNTAIPNESHTERELSSRLLDFLMRNINHGNRSVLRNNLAIVKALVECWKECITVPTEAVCALLSNMDKDRLDNRAGIQLLGILLANGLTPVSPTGKIAQSSFDTALTDNLAVPRREVFAACGAVVGMYLKHLQDVEKVVDVQESGLFKLVVRKLQSIQQSAFDRFVIVLHHIHTSHSPIVDMFTQQLLYRLPQIHGDFKTKCLEMLLSRASTIDDLFVELKSKNFTTLLQHRDDAAQQACLGLVQVMLPSLSLDNLQYLMPSVFAFSQHANADCRKLMYDILIWIYDNHHVATKTSTDSSVRELMSTIRDHLLRGLTDAHEPIRLHMFAFWNHETRLSSKTMDRLSHLLGVLYSVNTETQFLSCATNLLLELTSRSPDFDRPMFDFPLAECRFEDARTLNLSWQHRHLLMTPMFAASQSQMLGGGAGATLSGTLGAWMPGQLRQTQALAFTPTQDMAASQREYSWLTPLAQSQDVSSLSGAAAGGGMQASSLSADGGASQNILLFSTQPLGAGASSGSASAAAARRSAAMQRRPLPASRTAGPSFGTQQLQPTLDASAQLQETTQQTQQEIMSLKKRFLKDRGTSGQVFARIESRRQKLREERSRQQKEAREHRVVMYRKYRDGDLPDIQIKFSELIRPLQALAQRDSSLARLLFTSVFSAVFGRVEELLAARHVDATRQAMKDGVNAVLSSSTSYYAPFISAIFDISYDSKHLDLDPATATAAALAGLQQMSGIAVLERQLIRMSAMPTSIEPAAKRPRLSQQNMLPANTATWIELGRLYKSVGDWDTVRGIFGSEVGTKPLTQKALDAEARGDYHQAHQYYNEAMSSRDWPDGAPLTCEEDFWEDSYMASLNQLTQWQDLEKMVMQQIGDDDEADGAVANLDNIWTDAFYQEHYLPYLLRSKLKLASSGEHDANFLSFVSSAMKDSQHRAVLESRHSYDLALLFILQDDFDRARYYVRQSLDGFLEEWSSLSTLMVNSRTSRLQSLQRLTEMHEFLAFVENTRNLDGFTPAATLLRKWSCRLPDNRLDPIHIWDDIVQNRCVMMDKLQVVFEKQHGAGVAANASSTSLNDSLLDDAPMDVSGPGGYVAVDTVTSLDAFRELCLRERTALYLTAAGSARVQSNYSVARKYLKHTQEVVKNQLAGSEDLTVKWMHEVTQLRCQLAREERSVNRVDRLVAVVDDMLKYSGSGVLKREAELCQHHHLLTANALDLLSTLINNDGGRLVSSLRADQQKVLVQAAGSPADSNADQIARDLFNRGHHFYSESVKVATNAVGRGQISSDGFVKSLVALSNFCDSALRRQEEAAEAVDDSPSSQLDLRAYPECVVECLLTAMKHGSVEARQRFPRLLQLVSPAHYAYSKRTLSTFRSLSASLPSWMCISWISQMVAILDKEESMAVQPILKAIAHHYPQALCYPFKISYEDFEFEETREGRQCNEAVEELKKILNLPLVDDFIQALDHLTFPEHVFKDWFEHEMRPLLEVPLSQRDQAAIKQCWKELYSDILDHRSMSAAAALGASQSQSSSVNAGPVKRQFAQSYSRNLETKFGKDGDKLVRMTMKEFVQVCSGIYGKMNEEVRKRKSGPALLKQYSPWLSDFQASNFQQVLEIPGQYHGRSKPLPEYHVKIAGFDERILILPSMRKPKRLTIRGNDEKDHMFLVKGGEDLRLDQRIEQLFTLMNEIMACDPACSLRNLRLRTYEVIPMKPRVGMIEWMQNTVPLKDFMLSAMTEEELNVHHDPSRSAAGKHSKWVASYLPRSAETMKQYKEMYKKASRTETVKALKEKHAAVPWDILRRAYVDMSSSAESFLLLRENFARTLGTINVCQYVLGIGDRHLSNFMLDTLSTGGMIGIDFGHAFASATQFLPLPELMPFRLTQQFANLMLPLKEITSASSGPAAAAGGDDASATIAHGGLLRSTMIYAMRALRNQPSLLLSTMDVFVKEPSLDWKNFARRQAKDQGLDSDSLDATWYPLQKIRQARRKLNGVIQPTSLEMI
ncbi:DNA-dependent protein kinase catalytic subunit-like [Sycon ciliatum]|uniref:DNA-dependent protein kinase catalytic subunit-like n=1 Tax=Sycon ciliatum TaxID=27933 RepID=UPI0031F626FC